MRIVIVLDRELPAGFATNAAAVLAFSAARHLPEGVGPDLEDADGQLHLGITNLPIPILASAGLDELRRKALAAGVGCLDFSRTAQRARRYEEYEAALRRIPAAELDYLGLCLWGEDAAVGRLTGHLPLVK